MTEVLNPIPEVASVPEDVPNPSPRPAGNGDARTSIDRESVLRQLRELEEKVEELQERINKNLQELSDALGRKTV
jgi:hypothetical protein